MTDGGWSGASCRVGNDSGGVGWYIVMGGAVCCCCERGACVM